MQTVKTENKIQFYIDGVLDSSIPTCKTIKLCVQRHLNDLEKSKLPNYPYYFDEEAAERIITFFSFLQHSKGEWTGQIFNLEPWQQFHLGVLFGWKWKSTDYRRFRIAYIEVPRKNGKSSEAAGVGNYLFIGDGEGGAEVFSLATKRDQAIIVHSEAVRMVRSSKSISKIVSIFKNNLSIKDTASKYEPIGSDEDTMDGLNVHGAIIDELHAHKSRAVFDVINTATSARRQPLLFMITTAGSSRETICWQHHEHSLKILDGIIEDDSWFCFIAGLDEGADWKDETEWAKANPNLGISVKIDDLRAKRDRAIESPAEQNAFLRYHLNVWTKQEVRLIPMDKWRDCLPIERDLSGKSCYAGLDLASTTDIAALELAFPDGEYLDVLSFFWIPEESMLERVRRDRVPYDFWVAQGHIIATEGNVIHYGAIEDKIDELAKKYNILELAYDRWGATQLVQNLQEKGMKVVPIGQGMASMSAPTKELVNLVVSKKLRHGNNPVLSWMADNMEGETDAAGNIKPSKKKSRDKIDGMVALIMAIDRASRRQTTGSVYEERGIRFLD